MLLSIIRPCCQMLSSLRRVERQRRDETVKFRVTCDLRLRSGAANAMYDPASSRGTQYVEYSFLTVPARARCGADRTMFPYPRSSSCFVSTRP